MSFVQDDKQLIEAIARSHVLRLNCLRITNLKKLSPGESVADRSESESLCALRSRGAASRMSVIMNLVRGARASRSSRCTVIARAPRGPAAPAPAPPPTASSARARNTSLAPSSTASGLRRHRTRHITLLPREIPPPTRSSLAEFTGSSRGRQARTARGAARRREAGGAAGGGAERRRPGAGPLGACRCHVAEGRANALFADSPPGESSARI
ncbi:hypothetical protein RR46_08984 [Papilio xuthus]|uniref:Uncharacterized protein n=1 Tax=Papilio xuthus TaxID=66420 RepID=A0A194PWL3_PAPXU|nr:hypothetical protein RR46_08984 [Papilio xuthus]